MANIFQKIAVPKVHFSNFNLTHEWKSGIDMGYLYPCMCVECLPNDTFQGSTECFIRFAPMKFPLFQRMNAKLYTFFVPNRIIWKYWPQFIAEDEESVAPAMLQVSSDYFYSNKESWSLADSLGLPPELFDKGYSVTHPTNICLLPFLAYQKIFNDYFRDENLGYDLFAPDNSLYDLTQQQGLQSDPNASTFILRKKAWEKDYFTSALPEPQLGDPVPVPVVGDANITAGSSAIIKDFLLNGGTEFNQATDALVLGTRDYSTSNTELAIGMINDGVFGNGRYGNWVKSGEDNPITDIQGHSGKFEFKSAVPVDVNGLSFTINDLRLASAIQRFNELLARAGHRYKETILSMFNQVTPDYRLDRPEFICSCNVPVQIADIPQTSATVEDSPQATLAGKGTSYGNGGMYRYHCQEHGYLITLLCVIPRTSYVNGISRMWTRQDRYDFFTPVFENLGEQAIKNREVYYTGLESDDDDWGYAPRYAEYKYIPSTVHGDFRSSLDFMTLARMFDSLPPLTADFITPDDETLNRGFAVEEGPEQHLYVDVVNHLLARRPMQKLPIPKLS